MSTLTGKYKVFLGCTITAGVIMVASPLIGLIGTVLGMTRAFRTLGSSGVGDPNHLSVTIGEVLVSTCTGLIIGGLALPVFIVLLVLTIRASRQQPRAHHVVNP